LVLAGDITGENARSKVAHYFDSAPSGEPLSYPKKWVPLLNDNREEVMYDRVGVTRITRVWALPGLNDKDTSLMYLVNDSLAGNKNSPLRKKLVDELQLATRVYGSAYGRVLSGEYTLTVDLKPGVTPQQVTSIIDETIAEYLLTGPDQQILENAKLAVNMYMLGALETGSSIGRLLAEGFLYSDDPLFINQELQWLNAATADELRQIAGRWLTRGHYQLTVEPFPDLSSADGDVDRSSIPQVTASSNINFPEFQTTTLKNGMKLVVATRSSLPLIDVSIQIDTGSIAAPPEAPGLTSFLFGLMDKGTKKYDANELAAAKDKIGMSGRFRDGLERSAYSYRILRSYLESSLGIAADMLRNPTFPDEELTKYKARVSAYLANLEKAPARAAQSLFDRAVYGVDSPMGAVWTPQLLDQVGRARLETFHRAEIAPDRMTVFMIGDIGLDEASVAVNTAFGKWRATGSGAKKAVGAAAESKARVILVDHPGAESSTIIAGHAIAPYNAESSTEMSIMNRVLGGAFEARLNMNLREDKGWSYGYYSAISTNTSGDMSINASGQVQTDKTAVSMQEVLREISEFVSSRPATEDEVQRVKLNRTRSLPGTFATNRGFLSSMIRSDSYGLPLDYAESAAARVEAVTTDGVAARARTLLDPDKLTWVITGDLEKIEESVRALNYGDVEVWNAFGNKLR
jgi:predicted Zn-dependent peptidase